MAITKATASSVAPAAKGDLVVGSATNDAAVLGVGSNDQVLTADSSTTTGLKWAAASSGGMTLLDTLSLSGSSVTSTTLSGSSYKQIKIYVKKAYGTAGLFKMRLNGLTSSVYSYSYNYTYVTGVSYDSANNTTFYRIGYLSSETSASRKTYSVTTITRSSDSNEVFIDTTEYFADASLQYQGRGVGNVSVDTSAITSITIFPNSGSFSGGEAFIYGVN
jgi:hypothetical protein